MPRLRAHLDVAAEVVGQAATIALSVQRAYFRCYKKVLASPIKT